MNTLEESENQSLTSYDIDDENINAGNKKHKKQLRKRSSHLYEDTL